LTKADEGSHPLYETTMNDDAQEAFSDSTLQIYTPTPTALSHLIPKKHKPTAMPTGTSSDTINCICDISVDGFSIACNDCERWCHAACFDIVEGGVPDEWRCWMCAPRPVDKGWAVKQQTAKLTIALDHKTPNDRRKSSPGVERKGRCLRTPSTSTGGNIERPSPLLAPTTSSLNTTNTTNCDQHQHQHRQLSPAENEVVDVEEPWTQQYVLISDSHVPSPSMQEKLRQQAQQWRGLTALQSSSPSSSASLIPVAAGAQPQATSSESGAGTASTRHPT
jgi:uncharacterized protein